MNRKSILLVLFSVIFLSACSDPKSRTKAVYMLLDTSGTYTQEIAKAQAIINYLLGTLNSGDSLAVARIDSGSFSEKDIVAKDKQGNPIKGEMHSGMQSYQLSYTQEWHLGLAQQE